MYLLSKYLAERGQAMPCWQRRRSPDRARSGWKSARCAAMPDSEESQDGGQSRARRVRHRTHRKPSQGRANDPGGRTVSVRYDAGEIADVAAAAQRAGLTPTGFVASVALAVARQSVPPVPSPMREVLVELNAARTLTGRLGVNVNQAVAALHVSGDVPPELLRLADMCARTVRRVDEAVRQLQVKLP